MAPIARIQNLRIDFGAATPAVADVSFEVHPGEVLALVGESGSGKSLTARLLMGFAPEGARVTGRVELAGMDVLSADGETLRGMRGKLAAMVFQEPSSALNPVFTIGWQMEEGLRAHGIADRQERRNKCIEMLRAVGMPDPETKIDHYPHQFSGGQKQRVIIAMAIAMRPSLIIADEPTTALDVTVQEGILDLFRYCRDELGSAIILITHNIGIVADLADRVVVMKSGHVMETGEVRPIFAAPKVEYTRELLAAVPRLGAARHKLIHDDLASPPLALEVSNIDITYGGKTGFRAVQDVSFAIRSGEVLGLVGESGSGKSTIARAVAGLVPVSSGSIQLLGQPLTGISAAEARRLRARIGYIFQDPATSFNPYFTIRDCIAEPMRIHGKGDPMRRVEELFDQVELPRAFADRLPHELSGGQRQRVGIARALALEPDFIIADEPTSALDVTVQDKVLRLFIELQRRIGFSALFISHDFAVVEEVSAEIGVLQHGRLVELDRADRILTAPKQMYTKALLDAIPLPDPVAQQARRLQRMAK